MTDGTERPRHLGGMLPTPVSAAADPYATGCDIRHTWSAWWRSDEGYQRRCLASESESAPDGTMRFCQAREVRPDCPCCAGEDCYATAPIAPGPGEGEAKDV